MSTIAAPRAAVLAPLRDWLRTVTAVANLCGTDATLAQPSIYAGGVGQGHILPAVALRVAGLIPDGTVTERTLIEAYCVGQPGTAAAVEALAAAVRTAFEQAAPGTQLGSSTVRLMGATAEGLNPVTESDGAEAYVVTTLVTTKVVA